jgi:hypothetical protein
MPAVISCTSLGTSLCGLAFMSVVLVSNWLVNTQILCCGRFSTLPFHTQIYYQQGVVLYSSNVVLY